MAGYGIDHELNYWRGFVESDRFKTNWLSKPNPEMDLYPELKEAATDAARVGMILDVGCGVISYLRGFVPDGNFVCCDPLAPFYQLFFDYAEHGEQIPDAYPAENLWSHYPEKCFRLVHMSNALDHCADPVKVMDNLFFITESYGGKVIIQGFENEAVNENWQGMHRWNLTVSENMLYLSGKDGPTAEWNAKQTWRRQIEDGRFWIGAMFEK